MTLNLGSDTGGVEAGGFVLGGLPVSALDRSTTRTGTEGWHVEVDHSDGTTRTPTVIDDPQRDQQINGLPSVRIPVPRDETWQAGAFTDAPMRVWKDGIRQPIEELRRVETTPEQTVLVGVGGIQLERRVETQFDIKPVDDAVRQMAGNVTGYTVNVDDFNATTQTDVRQQSTSLNGFDTLIQDQYLGATRPIEATPSALSLLQSCQLRVEDDFGGLYTVVADSTGQSNYHYSAEYANLTSSGDNVTTTVTPAYDLPADRVGIAVSVVLVGSGSGTAPLTFNGVQLDNVVLSGDQPGGDWQLFDTEYAANGGGDLTGGTQYTVDVTLNSSDFDLEVDAIALYDTDYPPTTWDEPTSLSDTANGPELYPESYTVQTIDSTPPLSVSGGFFDGTFDDVSEAQQIELSNDQGATWPLSASNSQTLDGDFSSLGPAIRARITLSNYASGDSSVPTQGDAGQSLSAYELFADLNDTPLAIDQAHETRLLDVLKYYASYSDCLFEVRWDAANDTLSFEWSQPGGRSTTDVDGAADYESSKTTENIPDQIRVQGSAIPHEGEVTAPHDTEADLIHSNLVTASERVVNQSTGEQYTRGVDYTIDYIDGSLTYLSSGSIADGQTTGVSYRWQPDAYEIITSTSDPTIRDVTIQGLVTERGCGIAARRIGQQIQTPLYETSVTLPDGDDWSLLDELDPAAVPTDGPLKVRAVEETPQGTTLTLGSRERLGEIIDDVRTRIEQVSQRT